MEKKRRKLTQCPNCGYAFEDVNNYCPNCGQENHELNVPVKHLLWEFLEGTLHYDTKFWRTLKYLLFRPGLLTEKFNQGQRASYVPPFRLYVFISFLFFFLLAINHKVMVIKMDEDPQVAASSASQQVTTRLQEAQRAAPGIVTFDPQDSAFFASDTVAGKSGFEFGDSEQAVLLEKKVQDFFKNSEQSRSRLLKNTSLMMFVLMPFFAYLLYLFYYRQRRNYVEHLMFSIHLHAFIFILLSIVLLLTYVIPEVDLGGWVFLIMLLYTFLALRQVYKNTFWRTFFMMIPIVLIYFVSLIIFILSTFLVSAVLT